MILACGTGGCLVVGIVAGLFLLCKYIYNRVKKVCTCKKHGCNTKPTEVCVGCLRADSGICAWCKFEFEHGDFYDRIKDSMRKDGRDFSSDLPPLMREDDLL